MGEYIFTALMMLGGTRRIELEWNGTNIEDGYLRIILEGGIIEGDLHLLDGLHRRLADLLLGEIVA